MTLEALRETAYSRVISHAISPCARFLVFGTSRHRLFVYAITQSFHRSQFVGAPERIIPLEPSKVWHSLCSSGQYLFCGSGDRLLCFLWTVESESIITLQHTTHLPASTEGADITSLLFQPDADNLYVATSSGDIYVYTFSSQLVHTATFRAHQATIHALCSAGPCQFATCSEDGYVRFWDHRQPYCQASSFYPHCIPSLSRPQMGHWLTALACDPTDSDWFVTGGGPNLALWNRRAKRNISLLLPDESPDHWYAQTTSFCSLDDEPWIVAGGDSGKMYRWDHSGSLLSSLCLADPAHIRIGHILVLGHVSTQTALGVKTGADSGPRGVLVAAGAGPAIRLVSFLGYPLGILSLC